MDNELIYSKLQLGAKEILERMQLANYECYLVGGSLRDLLLAKQVHDYDFTSNARPEQVKSVFANERVIETGIKHGTVTVLLHGQTYEITTFRKDTTYSDHRHPDGITFADTLEEDLARRDFTINALAWSKQRGLVDLYGGMQDLQHGVIRAVNEPLERMHEDALRILRALRFASTLEFTIEPKTKQAIFELMPTLSYVARERILEELDKLFIGPGAYSVLTEFSSAFQAAYPEFWASCSFQLQKCLPLFAQVQINKAKLNKEFGKLISMRSLSNLPLLESYFSLYNQKNLPQNSKVLFKEFYLALCWACCLEPHLAEFKRYHKLINTKQVTKKLASTFLWSKQRRDLVTLFIEILSPNFWQNHLLQTNKEQLWANLICTYSCEAVALSLLYALASGRIAETVFAEFMMFISKESCFSLRDLNVRGDTLLALGKDIPKTAISQNLKQLWQAVLEGKVKNDATSLKDFYLVEIVDANKGI